jgi:hypothetical protein
MENVQLCSMCYARESVCSRDIPCLSHLEQDLTPSTQGTCPHLPPYLPSQWRLGLLVALNKDGSGQCVDRCEKPNPESVAVEECT